MTLPPAIPVAACLRDVPCDLTALHAVCQEARQFFGRAGLSEADVDAWELGLMEGLANAVKYCRPESRHRPIRVDLMVAPEWSEARINDHTSGFEWPEKAELPAVDSESGRGIFLIQQVTDRSCYLRGRDGNCLVMFRHRPASATPSSPSGAPRSDELREAERTLELMTEELASTYESLSAIFRFSSELQGGVVSEEFLHRWLAQIQDITEADWVVMRLSDRSSGRLRMAAKAGRDAGNGGLLRDIAPSETESVEARAARQQSDIWFDGSAQLVPEDPLATLAGDGCGLSHPLTANEAVIGVLTLGRDDGSRPFAAGQVSVIHTFGDFLGLQIRSSQMHDEEVRSRINERDLEIAANLQQALLPRQLPTLPGTALARFYRSARQVGGDYYDALPAGEGGLLLAVADVMGKGLPAALFAFIFRSLARSRPDLASRPGEFLAWLNQQLFRELDHAEMFITAQLVFLDSVRGEIRAASAGHPPLLTANAQGEVVEWSAGGPPLGIVQHAVFPEESRAWTSGHALMFTDGLIEARNPRGELLGIDTVKAVLAEAARRGESAGGVQERLEGLLRDFEQEAAPADDTAFIVITTQTPR